MFFKTGVHKNFAISTGKHLFLKYLQAFKPAISFRRHSKTDIFLWMLRNFLEHLFSRTSDNDCFWSYKIPLLVYMPVCYSVCLLSRFFLSFFLSFFCFLFLFCFCFFLHGGAGFLKFILEFLGQMGPKWGFSGFMKNWCVE